MKTKATTKTPVTKTEVDDDTVQPEGPTFKIFSGTLKAFEKADDTRKYLSCTASSTIDDLHGDRMTEDCVQDMAPQAKTKGMTIFLNHSYKVPEDVFGKTVDARIVSRASNPDGTAIYDLDLEIMLNEANQRAIETYAGIKDQGMKMGVSIGAMIQDYEFIDEEAGFWGGLEIKKVDLLEASIVGIPANQRSWVINSLNALGAPRAYIAKALGKSEEPKDDETEETGDVAANEPAAIEADLHEVTFKYLIDGVDVTDKVTVQSTDTILRLDADGNIITEDSDAPDTESPSETKGESDDELDPADDKVVATLSDATAALDSIKANGIDGALAEIVLGFLEGATAEVAVLRKANDDLTEERDALLDQVKEAAEIVETLNRTPLGRKTQFQGPVSTFRQKFGGMYDEGLLKLLEGADNDE